MYIITTYTFNIILLHTKNTSAPASYIIDFFRKPVRINIFLKLQPLEYFYYDTKLPK